MVKNSLFIRLFFLSTIVIGLNGQNNIQRICPIGFPDEDVLIVNIATGKTSERSIDAEPEPVITVTNNDIVPPDSVVAFARTLIGVPYRYASSNPEKGFDCSGFITYVFSHFNIAVPRSSVDFTHYGKEIAVEESKPGDLVLFTGTNIKIRKVGHMGMVESVRNDTLYFIHSSSGKANGVVISPLGKYYKSRFVKVIRVFADEYFN